MKVLVIGSGGQLGTDCIEVLGSDHEISPIDFPDIDIAERDSVAQVCDRYEPEVIINCAAYTAVDKCETETDACRRINVDGPRYIAEIGSNNSSTIIHISTDYVFDGKKEIPQPYIEGDPVNPLSEYGRTKLAGEQALLACSPNALVLRTAWLYSAHGPNFLKTMLRLALSDPARNFTIVDDQFGSLTWSYTLARQIKQLLQTDLQGVIHTTSEGYSSWFEAACYFLEKMEVPHAFIPCTTEDYPTPAHRPANSILRNKVLDDHGLSVFTSWKDDVDAFVAANRGTLLEEVRQQLS